MRGNPRTFALFVTLESSLGFLALLILWWTGISLEDRLEITSSALLRGLAACLPMLAFLLLSLYSKWQPLVELRKLVEKLVREMFGNEVWVALAIVSLAAGVGEELLFRGALQSWIGEYTGVWVAVLATSVLFGAAHALSLTYFFAATAIGLYLGWLTEYYDDLVAPMIAHAVYDFVALLVIRRSAGR